jgi:hypothetical protein
VHASGMPGSYPTRCLPERTGGLFIGTETKDELVSALRTTLSCAFSSELDVEGLPSLMPFIAPTSRLAPRRSE